MRAAATLTVALLLVASCAVHGALQAQQPSTPDTTSAADTADSSSADSASADSADGDSTAASGSMARSDSGASGAADTPPPGMAIERTAADTADADNDDDDDDDDGDEVVPPFSFGLIAGLATLPGSVSVQAISAAMDYRPFCWLSLQAVPSYVHAGAKSTTGRTLSSTGLTDLPLSAIISHEYKNLPWSPELAIGLELVLATGDTSQGLGSGQTSYGGQLGVGVSPVDRMSVDLSAWHPLHGTGVNSAVDAPGATSVGLEVGYEINDQLEASMGYGSDFGKPDSGYALPRSLAAGIVFKLAAPIAVTLNGARGLTSGAPSWLFSLGFGTTFAGINPLGSNNLLSRLQTSLGHGVNRGHGKSKIGGCKGKGC